MVQGQSRDHTRALTSASHAPLGWLAALAGLAGGLQALSLAWPWGVAGAAFGSTGWTGQPLPLLQLAAMALFVVVLRRAPTARSAAGVGWVFAATWLAGTFWWLFVSLHTHGGLAAPLAVGAVLALAGALAVYYAVISVLYWHLALDGIAFSALVFAAFWTLAELARGVWLTGFPWGAVGYVHVDSLGWVAPWVGVYGMGALAAVLAAGVALAWPRGRVGAMAVAGGAVALLTAGPWLSAHVPTHTQSAGALHLALLQGNIDQGEKFDTRTGLPKALAWYSAHLADPHASAGRSADTLPPNTLVVAPETALPLLPQQAGPELWGPLLQSLGQGTRAALLGLPLGSFDQGYSNAVWAITPQAAAQAATDVAQGRPLGTLDMPNPRDPAQPPFYRYEKHHLVPFGEFIPPFFRWFVDLMNIPLGDFNRGALAQPPFEWAGQRVAPNICYEDLFGEELAQSFGDAATAPTVLVNLSNLAWFGNTVALDQHLHASRLRALELARPMVRATNTGATVAIDHQGRVTHALPRLTQGVLLATVEGQQGLTPFARWASRWGLWPVWLLAGGVVLAGAVVARAQRTRRP